MGGGSTRTRRPTVRLALAALAAAGLAVAGAGPALAGGGTGPIGGGPGGGSGTGQTGSGSGGNGNYTSTVAENIVLSGSGSAGGYNDVTWTPPECWLQPDFRQPQTWVRTDPSNGPTDAASYWFWFGGHFPGFPQFISRVQAGNGMNGRQAVLQEFQQEQAKKRPAAWTGPNPITSADVWWVPNWLSSAAGFACATNLVSTDNLSDGYLDLEPPIKPGAPGPNGQITSQQLSALARAALRLPQPAIVTSPPVRSAVVNLPMDVSVVYANGTNLTSTATLQLDGQAYLWATVTAKLSSVQIQTSAAAYTTKGFGDTGQTCAATANRNATPACTITFQTPSGANPYTITVMENWTVSWTTSAGGGGTFPLAQSPGTTANVTVKEIQSQT